MRPAGVRRLGERLASVRNGHGDWQAAFSWLLGWVGEQQNRSMTDRMAYLGSPLTRRLGQLPEANKICERMKQEANLREDTRSLLDGYRLRHGVQVCLILDKEPGESHWCPFYTWFWKEVDVLLSAFQLAEHNQLVVFVVH
jgi:hypothetical protein